MSPNDDKGFPGYPAWLRAINEETKERFVEGGEYPSLVLKALDLHRRAERGDESAAMKIAFALEHGEFEDGIQVDHALEWHKFAAELGSGQSALRAAKLLRWRRKQDPELSIAMAEKAIRRSIDASFKPRYAKSVSPDDIHIAIQAAKILLDGKPTEDHLLVIEDIFLLKGNQDHPDIPELKMRFQKANCQAGHDPMSLSVANCRIVDDGEFRSGIYKRLELPISLMPLPDPDLVKNILDIEFPWFLNANEQVYRQLMAAQLSKMPAFRIRPLLLAGLPGVGKTTWASRLAELCGLPFRTVMAGGNSDSMFLRGTARGWASARPGAILQTMAIEQVANPLILVDEIDKASEDSRNGRIWDVLLQMMEPASSKAYLDECLQIPCDLSWVSWIATANELGRLPKPLLDRFTIILIEPPGEEHFMSIVNGSVKRYAAEMGLDRRMLPSLDNDDLDILRVCRNPREISRTARMILEERLVQSRKTMKKN